MIRGMHSAASALEMANLNQEVVAENLANVNTPGYRRQGIIFENVRQAALSGSTSPAAKAGSKQTATIYTNFDAGPLQQTGNPLDLSLSNNVFFVLDGP